MSTIVFQSNVSLLVSACTIDKTSEHGQIIDFLTKDSRFVGTIAHSSG